MNTETSNLCVENSEPSTINHQPSTSSASGTGCRRNGNIARLPKPVRDRINLMIQDGITYASIIEQLGADGKDLDISNLSRWKDGGYQDWLLEQSFIGQIRDRLESASDLTRDFDASQVNHAALQLGTLQIFDAFRHLTTKTGRPETSSPSEKEAQSEEGPKRRSPTPLDRTLGGNSAAFARLMNALARASSETLQLQKYRDACAKARAQLQPLHDPKRELNDDERRAIVRKVDEILGLSPEAYPCDTPATAADAKDNQ